MSAAASGISTADVVSVLIAVFLVLLGVIGFLLRQQLSNVNDSLKGLDTKLDKMDTRTTILETRAETFGTHEHRIMGLAQNQSAMQNELERLQRDVERDAQRRP